MLVHDIVILFNEFWEHLNAVAVFPGVNRLMVSFRLDGAGYSENFCGKL